MAGLTAASLAVAAGSALGGLCRYGIDQLLLRSAVPPLVTSTIMANLAGCLIIGIIAALSGPGGRLPLSPTVRHFLMAGFCGGLTTFSMLGVEAASVVTAGTPLTAAGHVIINGGGALLACALGLAWGKRFAREDAQRKPMCRR